MGVKGNQNEKPNFALGRENYKLLAIGFAIIVFGFLLMIGGKAESPDVFNEDIFSTIHHDLCNFRILNQLLQNIESSD